MPRFPLLLAAAGAVVAAASIALAQQARPRTADHAHVPGMTHDEAAPSGVSVPRQAGQSAYAAIAEIVGILESDPATDWSKVDFEALRQHLIDMDEVTLRAVVTTQPAEGGIEALVTGTGRTPEAIRRMSRSHAKALAGTSEYRMTVEDIPSGARVRIVAAPGAAAQAETRIRGLGFIGILTSGDHHAPHHLALARGDAMEGHAH
jgi:hypothetical protein